jgi:hypothetical protein
MDKTRILRRELILKFRGRKLKECPRKNVSER